MFIWPLFADVKVFGGVNRSLIVVEKRTGRSLDQYCAVFL